MEQQGTPQDRTSSGWDPEPATVVLPVHRAGPLGAVHARQRGWPSFGRFLWWAFLLPVAIFAWSSWRLRGVLRFGGYVLAAWVLLFGVVLAATPFASPAPPASVPVAEASAAPAIDPGPPATPSIPAAPPALAVAAARTAPPPSIPAPGASRPVASTPRPRPAVARAGTPAASASSHGNTYTNVDGNQVERPVQAAAQPAGATAKCQDGTWSFSQHHSGTCSGHGGVAQFL